MAKLICLFNHTLTQEQIFDAYNTLYVDSIITPPEDVKALWANIPVNSTTLNDVLSPVYKWLKNISNPEDYLLVQGDFGATYLVVRFAIKNCLIPIYSKTKRIAKEEILENGEVKLQHIFMHMGFRIYGL